MNTVTKPLSKENSNTQQGPREVEKQSEAKKAPSVGNPPYNEEFKAEQDVVSENAKPKSNSEQGNNREGAEDGNRIEVPNAQDKSKDANQKSGNKLAS